MQAVQGLQELRPKGKGKTSRFDIPEDPKERAAKERWLMFKADWLEALLEDTLDELQALERSEGADTRKHSRKTMKLSASYELTIDDTSAEFKRCRMVDVSVGGVRLLLDEQVSVNTPLKVNLEDGTGLEGTVVWSKKAPDDVKQYSTGVTFKEMNPELIEKIDELLKE